MLQLFEVITIQNIQHSMLAQHTKKTTSLSFVYSQLKRCYEMRKNARFWFGTLLALTQQISLPDFNIDCTQNNLQHFMLMLSYSITDIIGFYQKQVPEEVYHLLDIIHFIYEELSQSSSKQCKQTYRILMQKLHFYNLLGVLMMKNKQYSVAQECLEQVIQMYYQGLVDTTSEIFISAFHNYLFLMKTVPNYNQKDRQKQQNDVRMKSLESLEKLISEISSKYLKPQNNVSDSNILLILSVYNEHELFFSNSTKILCSRLFTKSQKSPKKMPKFTVGSQDPKEKLVIDKYLIKSFLGANENKKIGNIKVKSKQLGFYLRFNNRLNNSSKLRAAKETRTVKGLQFQPLHHHQIYQQLAARKINKNQQPSNLSHFVTSHELPPKPIPPQIELKSYSTILPQKPINQIQESIAAEKTDDTMNFLKALQKPITLKNSFILIKYVSEGIIFQNYLAEKQIFMTWQDISVILKNLKISLVFQEFCPLGSYYHLSSIFLLYIRKKQPSQSNKRTVFLSAYPNQLLYINQLVKLYKQDGDYLKILLINPYDESQIEFKLNCYIDDFNRYFKKVKENQYIKWINGLLLDRSLMRNQNQTDQLQFTAEQYRKNKGVTKQEIENRLKVEDLRNYEEIKHTPFSILLVIKNKRLLMLLDESHEENGKTQHKITFKIIEISSPDKNVNYLIIPLYRFIRYFPIERYPEGSMIDRVNNILTIHGKLLIETYLHCFSDYPDSFKTKQNMAITTYTKKIQLIKQGRYFTPVSAEIIGTETKILGIIFREYEQALIREVVTFVYNQSTQFLNILLTQKQSRDSILKKLLCHGSVKQSIGMIKKNNLRGRMVSIFQYLSLVANSPQL